MLSHISSFRLSSRHSVQVLTLSTDYAAHTSLSRPCLLVDNTRVWATSPLAVAVRCAFCGFFVFVFFLLLVMLPSEIPKFPKDLPVRGFPTVWKLLLHDSLQRMGLCPYLFCLSFCLLYFVLPPLEENGLPFWVPGVFCQHSEVVLWNFLFVFLFLIFFTLYNRF